MHVRPPASQDRTSSGWKRQLATDVASRGPRPPSKQFGCRLGGTEADVASESPRSRKNRVGPTLDRAMHGRVVRVSAVLVGMRLRRAAVIFPALSTCCCRESCDDHSVEQVARRDGGAAGLPISGGGRPRRAGRPPRGGPRRWCGSGSGSRPRACDGRGVGDDVRHLHGGTGGLLQRAAPAVGRRIGRQHVCFATRATTAAIARHPRGRPFQWSGGRPDVGAVPPATRRRDGHRNGDRPVGRGTASWGLST